MISIIVNMSKRNIPLQKPNVERITSRGLTYTILVITTSSKPISYTDNNICAEINNSLLKRSFQKSQFSSFIFKNTTISLNVTSFQRSQFLFCKTKYNQLYAKFERIKIQQKTYIFRAAIFQNL